MKTLNLPEVEFKIRKKEANYEIFDVIRRKYVVLTPEEWVRQHFIHYLINVLSYPKSLIKVENGLVYNKLLKRSDIVTYDANAQPQLLVECKSFKVEINQSTLNQATMYNKTLCAPYLVLTNGIKHYSFMKKGNSYTSIDEVPDFKKTRD